MPSECENWKSLSTSARSPASVSAPSPAWLVAESKTIVSVSPSLSTPSRLSGSANSALTMSGAETPAWPLICSPPDAKTDERTELRSSPLTVSADENSPPHRQRAAVRRISSVSGCDSETKREKPSPVSVVIVPPRLGPPSGSTDVKTDGCT